MDEVRRIVNVKDISICIMLMVCACYTTVLNCILEYATSHLYFLSIQIFNIFLNTMP